MAGERVQERVRRRIVGLSRVADDAGHGREQHERRQVPVLRQPVQVVRGIDLGPQHRRQPLRRQRGDGGVVENPGRVEDARQRVLAGNRLQKSGHGLGVRGVAGRDGDVGAQRLQLRDQLRGTVRVRSAPTGQQQAPHAVPFHEPPRDQPAQGAGAAGDEHGPLGVQPGVPAAGGTGSGGAGCCVTGFAVPAVVLLRHGKRCPRQPGNAQLTAADRELGLARRECRRERAVGGVRPVDIDEHEPARLLRLRRTDQPPGRRRGRIRHPVTVRRGDRAPGEHQQPRIREGVFGEEVLNQRQ